MSANSNIEWTDTTWSPITGCTRVSAGCDNCYSARMTHRLEMMGQEKYRGLTVLNPKGDRHFNGKIKTHESVLADPFGWRKPRKIFVCSMSDLFHKDVPFEFIDRVFAVMSLCPQHTFQVLTKRPERMAEYLVGAADRIWEHWKADGEGGILSRQWIVGPLAGVSCSESIVDWSAYKNPLPNVWFGTSVEDQQRADERIPHLLNCPAAVRFLSCEPLLGPIDLDNWLVDCPEDEDGAPFFGRVSWVIVGGESGPGARPMHPNWARGIRDQCVAAGVPYFFKQWGEWIAPDALEQDDPIRSMIPKNGVEKVPSRYVDYLGKVYAINDAPCSSYLTLRVGKKAAGRMLDGRTWDQMPEAAR